MDGFHLADRQLRRLGLLGRKGAPETFDAPDTRTCSTGARRNRHAVYAPGFDRDLEQPLAAALVVLPTARLVVTEGNYLLLDDPAWARARRAMDRVWFVAGDERLRTSGWSRATWSSARPESAARAWVADVDQRNARSGVGNRAAPPTG